LQKSQPEDYPRLNVFVLSYSSESSSESDSSQSASCESSCVPSRCTSQTPSCEASRNPSRCPSHNPSRSQSRCPSRPISPPPPLSPCLPDTEDDAISPSESGEFDVPVVKWAIDVESGCDRGVAQEVESAFKYHILAQADSLGCDLGDDHDLDCSPRSPRKKKRGRRGGRRHRRLTYLLSIPEDDHRRELYTPARPSSSAVIYLD